MLLNADQDVGRLDVAMDHRELRVQVVERADHLEQRIGKHLKRVLWKEKAYLFLQVATSKRQ